jgi:hypothetical protein
LAPLILFSNLQEQWQNIFDLAELGGLRCRALFLGALFFAEDDFALAYELIVEPDTILVGGALEAEAWRAAQQAHTGGGLKNVGRKRAAVDVEFDAKIAGVGDPGDLISWVENNHLGYESNKYGTLCHISSAPCFVARCRQPANPCAPPCESLFSLAGEMHYSKFTNSSTLTFKSWMIPRNVLRFNSPLWMGITTRAWSLART